MLHYASRWPSHLVSVIAALCALTGSAAAQVTWTAGGPGNSWATGGNWSNGSGPGSSDIARFTAAGDTNSPVVVTNVLNIQRTIGGLVYETPDAHFQSTSLAGLTLAVAGDLDSGFDIFGNVTNYIKGGGTLNVGTAQVNGNLMVGRVDIALNGFTNTLDLSGINSFNGQLGNLWVGTSSSGQVGGQLVLPGANTIQANSVRIGYSLNNTNNMGNTLTLGNTNTITANEFTVGGNLSNGSATIPANGSLSLGTSLARSTLTVGQTNTSTAFAMNGSMNLAGSTFNAFLGSVVVGEKTQGGGGGVVGILTGGNAGAIDVGAAGNTANFLVGHVSGGNTSSGNVDFSGQTSLTASLNHLYVGTSEVGTATGTLMLAATNTIDAHAIRVGYSTNDSNTGSNVLALGNSNAITTNEFTVGGNLSNGSVTIPANGSLSLGTSLARTALSIGQSTTSTAFAFNGSMNLSSSTFNAFLGSVVVGEKTLGGGGGDVGILTGGNAGAIDIGASGNSANFLVGHTSGGNSSSGNVDFSGQTSLTASLNNLYVGTSEVGTATGTLKLAATSSIDAHAIRVGYSTNDANNGPNLLALGNSNTITTNEFTVGGQRGTGSVSIPSGGTLNLGTAAEFTDLYVGRNNANTSASSSGNMDLSAATVNAFLGTVVVGEKSGGGTGGGTGTFTTGLHGTIEAQTITLGVGTGSGTFNFNGGTLTAGFIGKGTGTAAFNWNDGILHVGNFGTSGLPMNLVNMGTGTLAPGDDPGLTTVFGNYSQGASASLQIELGGLTPGSTYDQVVATGNAAIGGDLSVVLFGGFNPTLGESFKILTAGAVSGNFSHLALPALGPNLSWSVDYEPTFVALNVVPEPNGVVLAGLGLVALTGWISRRRVGN